MRKVLLITAFFVSTFLMSQVTYGVKAGMNMTNQTKIHSGSGSRVGINLGGFATIPLSLDNNMYYFQPELLYSQQGEKNVIGKYNSTYQVDYINLPLLFKAYFSEQETEVFGVIGPQLGFLVYEAVKTNEHGQQSIYKDDEYNPFDYGIVAGLGFSYNRKWEIDLRYFRGFADTVKNDADNDEDNLTSNVHFGIAYRF